MPTETNSRELVAKLPQIEGIQPWKDPLGVDAPPFQAALIGQNTTLADLAKDYALFTHAMLFTRGGLDHDPINDYLAENQKAIAPLVLMLDQPILFGMARPLKDRRWESIWDRVLMLCPKEGWPPLYDKGR